MLDPKNLPQIKERENIKISLAYVSFTLRKNVQIIKKKH